MQVLGLVALIAVATLWSVAFAMWVLGLPRGEARTPGAAAPPRASSGR